jgi:hypothetical protein
MLEGVVANVAVQRRGIRRHLEVLSQPRLDRNVAELLQKLVRATHRSIRHCRGTKTNLPENRKSLFRQ